MEGNKIDTILWDLDGTLVDPRERLYRLFVELTGANITFERYWSLKWRGVRQSGMLDEVGYRGDAVGFHKLWLANVERKDLIEKDTLREGASDLLTRFAARDIHMFIVTNRQSMEMLRYELSFLGIDAFFQGVISTFQRCKKSDAVKAAEIDIGHAVLIGDSDEDMAAAEELGVNGILVEGPVSSIAGRQNAKLFDEIEGLLADSGKRAIPDSVIFV